MKWTKIKDIRKGDKLFYVEKINKKMGLGQ